MAVNESAFMRFGAKSHPMKIEIKDGKVIKSDLVVRNLRNMQGIRDSNFIIT